MRKKIEKKLKKMKFKNLILLNISLIYFFFSFIIFFIFYGSYIKMLKNKNENEINYSLKSFLKIIDEEKKYIMEEANKISSDWFLIQSLKNNILIQKDIKIDKEGKLKISYKDLKNDCSYFLEKYVEYKKSKYVDIYNEDNVLISTSYFNAYKEENFEKMLSDIMKKENKDGILFIQKTKIGLYIRALSLIKDYETNEIYGIVAVNKEIDENFLLDIKSKIEKDLILTDYKKILSATDDKLKNIEHNIANYKDVDNKKIKDIKIENNEKYKIILLNIKDYYNKNIAYIGITENMKIYTEYKKNIILKFLIFQILFLILLLLTVYYTIEKLFKPFSTMLNNLKYLKEGKYSKIVHIKTNVEIDELEKDFNEMIEAIEERENALVRLNINLEEKVKERTIELFQKNKKLEILLNEVEKINKKVNEELEVARRIHNQIVKFQTRIFWGYKLYMKNISVGGIGGDFIEIVDLDNGNKGVIFADVAGHGVAAALMVSALKLIINIYFKNLESPSEAMYKINDIINQSFLPEITVSMVYFIIEKDSNKIKIATASQEDMYVIKENMVRKVMKNGIILGVLDSDEIRENPTLEYRDKEIEIKNNDKIFVYTDGLVENSIFNRESIEWELEKMVGKSGEDIYVNLSKMLDKSNIEKKDDITYLILEKLYT